MGFLDLLGLGQPDWVDGENKVRELLEKHLTKNDSRWTQISAREKDERITNGMEAFSNRIESFLVELMGKEAFVDEFMFRMARKRLAGEDLPMLTEEAVEIVAGGKKGDIDTRQYPKRYETLTSILFHFCGASGGTNKNLRAIWKDFLLKDLS